MWSKLVAGSGIAVALALIASLVWGEIAFGFVLFLVGFGLLAWLVNAYIWVRVPALEAAMVFNTETKAFVRYLHPGRHFLLFPWERIEEAVSLATNSVRGKCTQAQTNGGLTITVNWSMTYVLNPDNVAAEFWPRMARTLPYYADQLARTHGSNCVAQLVSELLIEALTDEGARGRLERELRQRIAQRVRPFGIQLFRVMLLGIDLPAQVQATLEEAHERVVHANSEAVALERLQQAVNQFSDADMERLIQLKQLHMLGQNGVALQVPMMQIVQNGGQSQHGGAARSDRKTNGPGAGTSTGVDSGQDWPLSAH